MNKNLIFAGLGVAAVGAASYTFGRGIIRNRILDNLKKIKFHCKNNPCSDGQITSETDKSECFGWMQASVSTLITRLNIRKITNSCNGYNSPIIGKLSNRERIWVRSNSCQLLMGEKDGIYTYIDSEVQDQYNDVRVVFESCYSGKMEAKEYMNEPYFEYCQWLEYGGIVGSEDINGTKCQADGLVYSGYVLID
jgi:hypothetical protein